MAGTCWFVLNKPAVTMTSARAVIASAIDIAGLSFLKAILVLSPLLHNESES